MKTAVLLAVTGAASTFAAAISAVSATNENSARASEEICSLDLKWADNWQEGGFRRYRVQWTFKPDENTSLYGEKEPWKLWCNEWQLNANGINEANKACWAWNDSTEQGFQDITSFVGENGHNIYKDGTQEAADKFGEEWGCTITTDL